MIRRPRKTFRSRTAVSQDLKKVEISWNEKGREKHSVSGRSIWNGSMDRRSMVILKNLKEGQCAWAERAGNP